MTKNEIWSLIRQLKFAFETVRLVDVTLTRQYFIDDGGEIRQDAYHCYTVWGKNGRCENCISAKVFAGKEKMTKLEFSGQDIYYVIAMYVEVEETPYVLEMVSMVKDESLFGAYKKDEFIDTISHYNKKLYTDPLTGAYNRQYYEEQLVGLRSERAVAMLDADDFKKVNDTYGHDAGDVALQAIVQAIITCITGSDSVIRYGGDEFLLIFQEDCRNTYGERLEKIRTAVEDIRLREYPDIRLSVSIGGVYCAKDVKDPIREADKMLYKAKEEKNSVRIR